MSDTPRTPVGLMLVALMGVAGGLAYWASQPVGGANTLDVVKDRGVLRVGFANEAPYAYRETASGELKGEAPAIAQRVAKNLGVSEVQGVLTEFGALIPGLKAGRFDVIAAGMYITPKRCGQIDFSRPTYCVEEALIVPEGNPLGLKRYADVLAVPGGKLGVVAGTVQQGYARDAGLGDDRIAVFPDAPTALEALRAGRATAFACTELTGLDLLGKGGDGLELAADFEGPMQDGKPVLGCGAFGFRPDDDTLREAFDAQLTGWLDGEQHRALVQPFGFGPELSANGLTAADLCGP